jgi:hypothetical protein
MDNSLIAVFVFYAKAAGIQSKLSFSKEFKHANVTIFDGDVWLHIDFDRPGIIIRKINCASGSALLRHLKIIPEVSAIISVQILDRFKKSWFPWWVRSCNEVARYSTGIDVGFTFNPIHLYRKLLKYRHRKNYVMLSHWRRKHGVSE